jgi:tyrosyl-tRNA synthetase
LADDVTALVHSTAERDAAVAAAAALFGGAELGALSESTLAGVVAELGGGAELSTEAPLPNIVEAMERSGVVPSKAAARRAIVEGGAYLNNKRITDPDAVIREEDLLHDRYVILRRGKKTVGALTFAGTDSEGYERDRHGLVDRAGTGA